MKRTLLLFLGILFGSITIMSASSFYIAPSLYAQGTQPPATEEPDEEPQNCEDAQGLELSWIFCPALRGMDALIRGLDGIIHHLLQVPNAFLEQPGLELAWSRVRNLAYFILVPILLVMVIGTALGFDFVSAYTVKRALPRLVIAVIFIALSFEITKFLVILTNNVGNGISGIITSAFGAGDVKLASLFNPEGGAGDEFVGFTVVFLTFAAGAALLSFGILMSYAFVTLLAFLGAFFLLTLRQVLIIGLMILAPLAILSWIFPGNDRLWKLWWGTFEKLLLLYPLIAILIAVGKSFAKMIGEVTIDVGGNEAGPDGIIYTTLKLVAYVGPYFLIPATFKFAGGTFASLAGMVNNKEKGLFDRNRKYRQGKYGERVHDLKNENRFKGAPPGSLRSKLNRVGAVATNINQAGLLPHKMAARMNTALSTQRFDQAMEAIEKDSSVRAIKDNEALLLAGTAGQAYKVTDSEGNVRKDANGNDVIAYTDGSEKSARAYLLANGFSKKQGATEADLNQAVASVMRARESIGTENYQVVAAVASAGTGTGYAGGAGEMYYAINQAAGEDRALASRMLGAARSLGGRARRPDLEGGGYGASLKAMNELYDKTREAGSNRMAVNQLVSSANYAADERTLESTSGNYIVNARTKAVEKLAPVMINNIEQSYQGLNKARIELDQAQRGGNQQAVLQAQRNVADAEQHVDRELAKLAGRYDAMAQVAPENAEALAKVVFSHGMNVPHVVRELQTNAEGKQVVVERTVEGATIRQLIEDARKRPPDQHGNQAFLEMRREYASAGIAAAEEAARTAGQQVAGLEEPQ